MNNAYAKQAIEAATKKAEELDVNMNIAVVDLGARLVTFSR